MQVWLDDVKDYALIDTERNKFKWVALRDDEPDNDIVFEYLDGTEDKWYDVNCSPSLNTRKVKVLFEGTEAECRVFVQTTLLIEDKL